MKREITPKRVGGTANPADLLKYWLRYNTEDYMIRLETIEGLPKFQIRRASAQDGQPRAIEIAAIDMNAAGRVLFHTSHHHSISPTPADCSSALNFLNEHFETIFPETTTKK